MLDAVPSCFTSKSGIAKTSAQNLVTCNYVAKLGVQCRIITVTWSKTALGNALSVAVGGDSSGTTTATAACKVDLRPWKFWRKQGSKRLFLDGLLLEVFWDLGSAKFLSTPEPREKFYVAVVCNEEAVLLLGDMGEEAYRRSRSKPAAAEAVLLSRKEHVFGDSYFATRAQFGDSGRSHEVGIECQTEGSRDPSLFISVDRETVMEVKRLAWKFRGNDTISVGGVPVEIYWDVHDWLFNPPGSGHAMFVFKPGDRPQNKLKSASCNDGKSDFCLMLYAWKSD